MDEKQQELMFKFQMFEQQIRQVQEQLQAVEQGIIDMSSLALGIEELKGKKDKEILAPIGRGIFAKAKLISEELTVDVGGKNFVKKSISETSKIIREQVAKLEDARESLNQTMEKINEELTNVMEENKE